MSPSTVEMMIYAVWFAEVIISNGGLCPDGVIKFGGIEVIPVGRFSNVNSSILMSV